MKLDRYCFQSTKGKVLTKVGAFFYAPKWCPFCPGITVRFAPECSMGPIVCEISGGNCSAMLPVTGQESSVFKYPVFNQKVKSAIFRGLPRKINLCSY